MESLKRTTPVLPLLLVVVGLALLAGGQAGAEAEGAAPGSARSSAGLLATGTDHSCALSPDHEIRCWGFGAQGQLGQGNPTNIGDEPGEMGDDLPPVDLGTGRVPVSVSAAYGTTCAIFEDGDLKCWGANDMGQLGQGHTDNIGDEPGEMGDNLPPVDLGTGRTATAVATSGGHTCALLDDGTVKCWGFGSLGRLGQGSQDNIGDEPGEMGDNLPPVDLGTGRTATAITTGGAHTCALLDDGTVKCWGYMAYGQLGIPTSGHIGDWPGEMGDNLPAVDLGTGRTAVAIAAGTRHTCALLDDGTVKCWGSGEDGRLGRGSTTNVGSSSSDMGDNLSPVDLGAGRTAVAISTGGRHTCALLDDGTVKCWGLGSSGQLGTGGDETRGDQPGEMGDNLPAADLGTGRTAVAVSAGEAHTCALLDDGTVKCWGYDVAGQLGQGTRQNLGDQPGEMGDALPPVDLTSAPWAVCHPNQPVGYWLVEADGTVYAFGDAVNYGNAWLKPGLTVVDIAATPTGCGYWTLRSDGLVQPFGDAPEIGSFDLNDLLPGERVASMSVTPTGTGLWAFTDRGRVLTLGDATPKFAGGISDLTGLSLGGPIIDSVTTPSGNGYYMLGSDGGVFAFGDASYSGSLPALGVVPAQPTVGLVPDPDGSGYWLVAADGGVFAFDAPFRGSVPGLGIMGLNAPVVGMTPYSDGYLQVASDGGVFDFSPLPFSGGLGSSPPDTPIVALAAVWR